MVRSRYALRILNNAHIYVYNQLSASTSFVTRTVMLIMIIAEGHSVLPSQKGSCEFISHTPGEGGGWRQGTGCCVLIVQWSCVRSPVCLGPTEDGNTGEYSQCILTEREGVAPRGYVVRMEMWELSVQ